ncbi:IS607 family transposase [Clostridium perfringens]
MRILTIGEFAKAIGKSQGTLRNWERSGKLIPHHKTEGGTRYYTESQVNEYLNLYPDKSNAQRKIVGYCRVSTKKQKDDLERQVESVKTYCLAKGYQFEIIEDIGSGINYDKKGLKKLIKMVTSNEVEKIVILYKDRLVRFGFELIQNICNDFNVEIEIIDRTPKTDEEELVEDMIQIVTVFSCRLQGKRANRAKKILKELSGI